MLTLRDLLKLNETVTLLELYVREPDRSLIRRSIIGDGYIPSRQERRDIEDGKLEFINRSINKVGRANKAGMTEIAYGMDWTAIPKAYLDAEVTDIGWLHDRMYIRGCVLHATIVPIQLQMDCSWR